MLGLQNPVRWSKDAIEPLTLTMTENAEQLANVCGTRIAIRKQDAKYGTASIPERAEHCDTCSADFASIGLRQSILQGPMIETWLRWPMPIRNTRKRLG